MAKWGRQFFHKFREKVKAQKEVVNRLVDCVDDASVKRYFEEKEKLHQLLVHEEAYWKQRAKVFWLEEGDSNTRFFHASASTRKKMNHITSLKSEEGEIITKHDDLCNLIQAYFTNVFAGSSNRADSHLNEIENVITDLQNEELVTELSFEEFTLAVKQMHPDKASGPDGLNPAFFQHFWQLLGRDQVFLCCKGWLKDCIFPAELNDTSLVLIPKKDNVEYAKDLRPIALCNVMYKILAKVLANRLKKILPLTISEEQSAFVPGRNIQDNVLVAFEMIHYMTRKKQGQEGEVAVKLDISKAYDRVKWQYLNERMRVMGFSETWIRWIMLCVTTVSYSISFNGSTIGPILPTRGLRQGDPLSPYLFLLCVEGLSNSLREATNNDTIHGCKISPTAPSITHLLFADDSFLFFKATTEEANSVKHILKSYEHNSGQAVNFQKSGIFFGSNVRRDKQAELKGLLGVHEDIRHSKYLGLPSLVGRSKKSVFNFLKDKVGKRIQGWSTKLLSKAGKAVMLKNVAQAIPAYCMSCFLLPKTLCKEIERMMNAYWWSSNSANTKGVRWLAWDRMSMTKKQGGMGFRDLYGFNLALLGKHCWNFVRNPGSLVARVYKARYFPHCHMMKASKNRGSSYIWAGIWEAKEMLAKGYRWILGDGQSITICSDPWLRGKADYRAENKVYPDDIIRSKVNEFFVQGTKVWDAEKVIRSFDQCDANAILTTRIPQNSTNDRLAWVHSADGQYSARTGYKFWHEQNIGINGVQQSLGWGKIWRLNVPHKLKIFLWRFCRNTVPVKNRLRHKGITTPIGCSMCVGDIEHMLHIFFDCEYAKQCWQVAGMEFNMWEVESAPEWLLERLSHEPHEKLVTIATVLWSIWFARNKRIWENVVLTPATTVALGSKQVTEWREVWKRKHKRGDNSGTADRTDEGKWVAPELGSLKINVDASVFKDDDFYSIGMVLRDHVGKFLMGKVLKIAGKTSVLEAESVGVLEALLWSREIRDLPITIETDSLLTVNAIQKGGVNHLELGNIIQQCREVLASRKDLIVVFVKKLANNVAHGMARLPCTLNSSNIFMSPPQILLETIMYDSSTI